MAGEKDKVESAIVRAQKELEEALSELEAMPALSPGAVAFAAHTLNNYLTVTGGTVELMLGRLADSQDQQAKTALDTLQHVTHLMQRTVSQLMNVASATESDFRLENVDLLTLVQRVCHYYQRIADQKGIRVIAGSAGHVPPVWTDRVAVAAVLDNLLSNAVKYSLSGTQIDVQLRGENGWVRCDVRDQGPGLSKEDQDKLFERGARLTPKPTGGEPSTGYGLAVAKELMEKMGGEIWCESVLGQGACFSIRVPAYDGRGSA